MLELKHGLGKVMKDMPFDRKQNPPASLKEEDTRLLRAARRIIRLYDLEAVSFLSVKPESLARIIAQELNAIDTAFLRRMSGQNPS